MTVDVDLPDLQTGTDTEIVADNVRAVGAIYSIWLLDQAGAFRVVDRIVELFSQGLLPLGQGRVSRALYRIWRQGDRMLAQDRAAFYARALGVPGGDASAGEPNREFLSLWLRFLVAVSMFAGQQSASGLLVPPTPVNAAVRAAARALAANASGYGGEMVQRAARRLIEEVQQLLGLLNEPELLQAFGARNVWQLIDRVHREHLGRPSNVARYRSQAAAGSRIFDWLAEQAATLRDPAAGGSTKGDVAVVHAAELLLAAMAGDALVPEPPPDAAAVAHVPPDLLLAAQELVAALDLAGERNGISAVGDLAALFHGPAGTGKTLAAHVLARSLSLPLYRIDLAAIASKYIGETEKNLAALFERAEREGAALFFDEADALFGKRTDVRDSHDRYANAAIDDLLQRIAAYEGVLIVAASPQANIDATLASDAWRRRRWRVVRFPRPRG
jgi:ATPase family associated with various cellular activities (AAA)